MQYPLSDWDLVRATPLFAAISEANFRALRDAAMVNRFPKNTMLGKEGDRPRVARAFFISWSKGRSSFSPGTTARARPSKSRSR